MNCTEILMARDKMAEECGVFGIYTKDRSEVAQIS